MADGSGAKQFITEAIVNPIKDEAARMAEVGVQSVTGQTPTLDPQEEARKKQLVEQKKANIKQFLAKYQADRQRLDQENALAAQKRQQQLAEEADKKKVKQIEVVEEQRKEKDLNPEKKGMAEIKRGVGG